jgi:hypothetical protein
LPRRALLGGDLTASHLRPVDDITETLKLEAKLTQQPVVSTVFRHLDRFNEAKHIKMQLVSPGKEDSVLQFLAHLVALISKIGFPPCNCFISGRTRRAVE